MKRIAVTALMLLAMSVLAIAQPDAPPADENGWDEDAPAMTKLNLTDAQQKTISELRLQHQKELIPMRAGLQTKQLDLRGEMMADTPNMAKIYGLVDEIAKGRAEISKKKIAFRFKLRDQLTPEQRKIWDEQKGKMMRNSGKGRRGMPEQGMKRGRMDMHRPGAPFPPAEAR